MNKLYSLMLILFISASAFAAERPRGGRLTITTFDNSDIRVEIDGRRFNANDNFVRINNINSGYHNIQVWRRQSGGFYGNNRERLLYNSSVFVKPEFQIDVLIDRYGRAQVQEYDLGRSRRDRRNDDWNRRNDNGRWDDYGDWNDRNDRNGGYNNGGYNNGNGGGYNNGGYNNGYGRGVSYETFQSMKQTLRRENFENTRMGLARDMFDRNNFEAAQVREMLQLFSFENNKLDLAKYAYRNTIDKNNYYVVYDVFSFSSSRDELSRFCK